MKQLYTTPEMLCIHLHEDDILTASSDFISQGIAANDYTQGDFVAWG
ncbi:MAG: hypothetical protein IJW55_09615 [Clostridia bacterium]|nr:hypothetical protein [Clostridia bacterium]